jgi:hypothetical protein
VLTDVISSRFDRSVETREAHTVRLLTLGDERALDETCMVPDEASFKIRS